MNRPPVDPKLKAYKTAVMINPDGMYVLENMKDPSDVENDAFIQSEARKQNIIPNTPYYFDFIAGIGEYIRAAEFREADAAADAAAAAARRREGRQRRERQGGSKKHSNRRKRHSNRRKRHSNRRKRHSNRHKRHSNRRKNHIKTHRR